MQTREQFQSRAARFQDGIGIHFTGLPFDAFGARLQAVGGTVAAQADGQEPGDAASIESGAEVGELSFGRVPEEVRLEGGHIRGA